MGLPRKLTSAHPKSSATITTIFGFIDAACRLNEQQLARIARLTEIVLNTLDVTILISPCAVKIQG